MSWGPPERVVVTGIAGISPLGHSWPAVRDVLHSATNAVRYMPAWEPYQGLNTRLAAPAAPFDIPPHYDRKATRTMGRVALMATRTCELALADAGVLGDPWVRSGEVGIAFGSSSGTPEACADFARVILDKTLQGVSACTYLKMMSHTTAVNAAVHLAITGRVIPTSSACTSGSQGIGYAYETIRRGDQVAMLAGGAEELDITSAAVFDTLFATTSQNDTPKATPRPFDVARDGLVLGEGACAMFLEARTHALARGARILGEIVGFGTNCDGTHITRPNADTMARAMQLALRDAGLDAAAIGYINAHGTATEQGDIAEATATRAVLGSATPISTLKSYMGHTLGACGALEAWLTLEMLREGWFASTLNLDTPDPRCGELDFIMGAEGRKLQTEFAMTNNFAFGGINTSLILRRGEA